MQISARADYAVRAVVELAGAGGGPVKGEQLAAGQAIPPKFLEAILAQLRQHRILTSRRGADGGYWLARPAEDISLADIIRAADGPLASVRGQPPEEVSYEGIAAGLSEVWLALRVSMRAVLEQVSVADVVEGRLPVGIESMLDDPEARVSH